MSGGRADVTAFQLAAELVTDAPTSPSATTTSLLERSRRDHSSDGREATSVTTALQDAVMRWGKMKQSLDGADDQRDGQRGGVSSSPSSGFLRHSWRLVEAERRPASPDMTSSSVHPWMLGRRWERADDLMQANALGRAVQQELGQRPDVASASERFYQHGLQLCGESARSTAGLSACLSAVPSAPTLAFFSFSEEEYDALTQPPPSPVPPSTVTFTYPSSCHLVELWGRFGNPVVVVDRWAGEMADKRRSSQQAHPFRFSAASSRDTEMIRSSPSAALRVEETKGVDFAQAFVPTVEQACAEYSRVTSGVLGQRQQRLLRAVLAQQQEQQQEQQRQDSGQTSTTSVQRTVSAVSRRDSKTSSLPSADASGHAHTPFVASFDRYALLRCAKQPKAEERQEENTAVKLTLTQAVQRPPATPPAGTAMAVGDETSTEPPSSPPAPSSPSLSAATAAAGLTPQQHLLQCMTPSPWYTFMAEVERRAAVKELLGCERATNVPYQHAASKYLSLATTAAQALQRAAFMFDDRDREGQHQELAEVEQDTSFVSQRRADDAPTTPRCIGRAPPRSAFTVQLKPLPDVDPAAWRAAEAAVRKAAVEVLGIDAAGSAAPAAASAPASSALREQGRRGKRARADIAEGSHHGTRSAKHETNESARRASAATRRTKNSIKREEAEEEAGGDLDDGSNESSVASDDGGSDDDTSENGSTSSEEDDAGGDSKVGLDKSLEELTAGGPEEGDAKRKRSAQGRGRGGGATAAAATQASIAPFLSRVASPPPPSHLATDPSYRDVQAYITTVIPWRCTRLRVAAQAGWLLPPPPPLPHSLTDSLEEKEVVLVDVQAMLPPPASTASQRGGWADATRTATRQDAADSMGLNASPPNSAATGATTAAPCDDALYRPLMTEDEYQALRKISTAAVCNRVVSHTGEAVLLSLPPTVPRLYREVEQELERYLYDDTSAMMEVNATAQSLMAAIRTAYTQNTYLQRYTARLEHVVENLKKVEQECREAEKTSGDATLP